MQSRGCIGDGGCLDPNVEHVPCPNVSICGTILPPWACKGPDRTCMNCDIRFGGKLEYHMDCACPVCFRVDVCVSTNACNHKMCVDCFKKYYRRRKIVCPFPFCKKEPGGKRAASVMLLIKGSGMDWNGMPGPEVGRNRGNPGARRRRPTSRRIDTTRIARGRSASSTKGAAQPTSRKRTLRRAGLRTKRSGTKGKKTTCRRPSRSST